METITDVDNADVKVLFVNSPAKAGSSWHRQQEALVSM